MDQEPTDTQKQIIQHLHKLLEKPEDWKPSNTDNFHHLTHKTGVRLLWHSTSRSEVVLIKLPHALGETGVISPKLRESLERLYQETTNGPILAFLNAIPQ